MSDEDWVHSMPDHIINRPHGPLVWQNTALEGQLNADAFDSESDSDDEE